MLHGERESLSLAWICKPWGERVMESNDAIEKLALLFSIADMISLSKSIPFPSGFLDGVN